MTITETAPAATERWTHQWKELYEEVINTGLCTGCAGCVIACPHEVIGYKHEEGNYKPFHLEEDLGLDNCGHGEKGCTSCTRACPRFRTWEPDADMHLFGKTREDSEMYGQYKQLLLVRAADDKVHELGQDGGFVSAMLIWLMKHDYIDAALTSFLEGDGSSWKALPGIARTPEDVLRAAGSRYTYSANTLAMKQAQEEGLSRLALVGMSCQSSVLPIMWKRKVGKIGKPFLFNIGLLCSKTFDDAIFEELFLAKYGLKKEEMVKMNIKGAFQIWMKDGIGEDNAWTLCVVRTDLGVEVMDRMIADGSVIARPAETDATAMKLLKLLSTVSRRRWPVTANPAPLVGVPPPKKKADGTTPAPH